MKNIIAITSLLAAGTVFASAADLIVSFDSFTAAAATASGQLSKEGDNMIKAGNSGLPTFSDGSLVFSGSEVSFITSSTGGTSNNLGSITGGASITMTLSNVSWKGSAPSMLFTLNTVSVGANALGVSFADVDNLKGVWKGAVWDSTANTPYNISSKADSFVLTYVVSGGVSTLYIDGELAATWTGLGTTTNNTSISQYNIGNNPAVTAGSNMTLHNLYVHSGALSAEEVKSFVASIPEPSAFGLLAGVGALAFVAARRRRRAK